MFEYDKITNVTYKLIIIFFYYTMEPAALGLTYALHILLRKVRQMNKVDIKIGAENNAGSIDD